jgi:hypothetical protein
VVVARRRGVEAFSQSIFEPQIGVYYSEITREGRGE